MDYFIRKTDYGSAIYLSGFAIDGNKAEQTRGHGIVMASQVSDAEISNIVLNRVNISTCKQDGFHIIGNTVQYKISSVNYGNKSFTVSGENFQNLPDNGGDLTGNLPAGVGVTVISSPMNSWEPAEYTVASSVVEGNSTVISVAGDTMKLVGATAYIEHGDDNKRRANLVTLRNCYSYKNDGRGFFLDINQAVVSGCKSLYNSESGFELRDCASTFLTNCVCTTNTWHQSHGIYLNAASGGVSVTNCHIACESDVDALNCGIYVRSAHHAVIQGNVVRDYGHSSYEDVGIFVLDGWDCTVSGNVVIDCDVGLRISRSIEFPPRGIFAFGNHLASNDIAAQGLLSGANYLAIGPISHTSDCEIDPGYSGCVFSNSGATGPVTFELPPATRIALEYTFLVEEDGQELRIAPADGETVALSDGIQQAADEYIKASTAGATCRLKCVTVGQWEHFDSVGQWTAGAP